MRPCVVGEAAQHAGATDPAATPKKGRRGQGGFHARLVLQRGAAFHDVVATTAQPGAVPTTEPAVGTPLPAQLPSTLANRSPLPSARDPTRVVGMPLNAERASQHARTCRLSEMEKLIARVDKLERTLRELSARLDAPARKRPAQEVHQTGNGGNVGSIDQCSSQIHFGEGSTMNNYLLDRLIDECWPDKPK